MTLTGHWWYWIIKLSVYILRLTIPRSSDDVFLPMLSSWGPISVSSKLHLQAIFKVIQTSILSIAGWLMWLFSDGNSPNYSYSNWFPENIQIPYTGLGLRQAFNYYLYIFTKNESHGQPLTKFHVSCTTIIREIHVITWDHCMWF